jgi:guanylate kinase
VSPKYIRGGSLSTIFQDLTNNSLFQGGLKELGKTALQAGKKFGAPILENVISSGKNLLGQTANSLKNTILENKDAIIKQGLDLSKKQVEKLAHDVTNSVVNGANKSSLEKIIKNQKNTFKSNVKPLQDNLSKIGSEAQAEIVKSVRDIPTKVVNPALDTTSDQISSIITTKAKTKADRKKIQGVANLISGSGATVNGSRKATKDMTFWVTVSYDLDRRKEAD